MHIHIDFLSALTTTYCLISSSADEEGSINSTSSLTTGLATTLSTNSMQDRYIDIYLANNYIDSLTSEEIEQLDLKLGEKEEEFLISTKQNEKVKVYTKKYNKSL